MEPDHDRLAGTGVVGEQETHRRLRQLPLADRDSLMQKRAILMEAEQAQTSRSEHAELPAEIRALCVDLVALRLERGRG